MVDHYVSRVHGNLQLLQKLDLIDRTSEMARLFGIQFLHVLTRGSQVRFSFPYASQKQSSHYKMFMYVSIFLEPLYIFL